MDMMSTSSNAKSGACERCYRRKARCSRETPTCSSCLKANTSCVYTLKEGPIRRQDMDRLERRLRYLESKNKELNQQLTEARQAHPHGDQVSYVSPSSSHPLPQDDPGSTPASSEVVNQVSYLSLRAGGERQFLGSTSGLLLANLLQTSIKSGNHVLSDQNSSDQIQQASLYGNIETTNFPPRDPSVLPPLSTAKGLLSAYCNHDSICYPFLDSESLNHAFEQVYNSGSQQVVNPLDDFTVDMILAIGTAQVHKFDWHAFPDAETHYNRAITRFGSVLARGGMPSLQAVLLICQYRMGSSSFDTSASLWHLIGVAARMCFELGLHKKSTYANVGSIDHTSPTMSTAERASIEIKRRCFWCVLAMDRVASFVLGRPLAIQLEDVDADLPVVDATKLNDPLGFHSTDDAFDSPKWHLKTLIFVHIVRYRLICGKILTSLHRDPSNTKVDHASYEAIRSGLAMELEAWREATARLPLTGAQENPTEPQMASSFRSREWHELIYHNGILMLFRPSRCLSDAAQNSTTLEHIFNSAQKSINLYASLHRSRRINYSWVTLHSVFISGLSYVYALRYHFQHIQRGSTHGTGFRARLATTPSINQVVNDTRACSNVLVAVSERWSTARNCSQVFDKLSDAVLADVVDAQTRTSSLPGSLDSQSLQHNSVAGSMSSVGLSGLQGTAMSSEMAYMAVDSTLQDCFGDLQNISTDHYGSDAIAALSQDWLFGIQGLDTEYW